MKFSIEKNILLDALSNVTRALSQKITMPVLHGIKFELNESGLVLLASDSELTIKVFVPEVNIKKIDSKGEVIIQSKYILDIIRKMPSDIINFTSNDSKVKIFTDTNEFNLNCFDVKDYPDFNLQTSKSNLKIKSSELKTMIDQTSYAMSTQELRPLLTGLNLTVSGNNLVFTTTDSYRLAKKLVYLHNSSEEPVNVVVPGRSITEISKIIGDTDVDVEINFFSNKILFIYDNIWIQSNLLSGSFPDTSHMIPDDFAYMINLDLKVFYDAIDRASLLASNKDKNIIRLNIQDNKMLITSTSEEIGKTEEKIIIDSNKRDKIEISMSSKYLMDALKVIKDDNILLLLNTDDKPVTIKSVNDENFTELIVPLFFN